MKILNKEELINKIKISQAKFAWINTYSDLVLVQYKNENDIEKELDDLIEAKFFNENMEISIMSTEEGSFSVFEYVSDSNDYVEEEQVLNKHKSPFKDNIGIDKLVIRHYLGYDNDDGQAYVKYTKLHNVKKGGNA
ncbi:hypothetical protein [Clostridium sp. FP1]|uniref:hypothetical protein n=1 Tax=Clostridium sp. FP1 TaxID=2724076 RepID=UPI0013E9578A|nr:hypothetical protein [Clostridium sp. FP1]MBZ9634065.1 hypothetical protein [Clostridium sp. FP1]